MKEKLYMANHTHYVTLKYAIATATVTGHGKLFPRYVMAGLRDGYRYSPRPSYELNFMYMYAGFLLWNTH